MTAILLSTHSEFVSLSVGKKGGKGGDVVIIIYSSSFFNFIFEDNAFTALSALDHRCLLFRLLHEFTFSFKLMILFQDILCLSFAVSLNFCVMLFNECDLTKLFSNSMFWPHHSCLVSTAKVLPGSISHL